MKRQVQQITVRLDEPLHEFIARKAQQEDRSQAAVIRRLLVAARNAEAQTGAEAA